MDMGLAKSLEGGEHLLQNQLFEVSFLTMMSLKGYHRVKLLLSHFALWLPALTASHPLMAGKPHQLCQHTHRPCVLCRLKADVGTLDKLWTVTLTHQNSAWWKCFLAATLKDLK